MVVARQLFHARYGRGDELVEVMKELNAHLREDRVGAPQFRILTDLSGQFFTVVTEVEVESLAAWETTFREAMAQPWMGELFNRMTQLVESGSREFYTVVS